LPFVFLAINLLQNAPNLLKVKGFCGPEGQFEHYPNLM